MKIYRHTRLIVSIFLAVFTISLSNCSVHAGSSTIYKKLPPGQAKKLSGKKSARSYAPGHNK